MMEYNVRPNESVFLRLQLARTDTGLFPQAKIYAIDDPTTVVDTVNLAEIGNGLYGTEWTNNGERKKYFTQTIVYTAAYGTGVHPLIRPDSDSINIGFETTGGVFGRARGGGVAKSELTADEIKKIAQAVLKILKPELDKKSEFNPNQDIVKTDIKIPETKMPEMPEVPTVYDIAKAVVKTLNIDQKLKSIKFPEQKFPEVPTIEQLAEKIETIMSEHEIDHRPMMEEMSKKMDKLPIEMGEVLAKKGEEIVRPVIESKEASDSMLGMISALIIKKTQEEVGKEIKREDVIEAIRNGENENKIFKMFKQLSVKDKMIVFRTLAVKNVPLLKKLAVAAKNYA